MAHAIMQPLTPADEMPPENATVANVLIKPNDRLDSFERLQIYNQQYWWRLLGNFADDFHGLRAVLGQRNFDRLAVAYLEACGSRSWSLRDLGEGLVQYLLEHPDLVAPQADLALDMARVEWARVVAFDGPERAVLDAERISRLPPDRLLIGVQPYVTLLELWHPIDEMLARLRERSIETGSVSNAVSATRSRRRTQLTARRLRKPLYLAVHRHEFLVYYKRLEPEAFRLLTALREGATLDAACSLAFADSTELPEQSAQKIQGWFQTWMELRWLCR